MSVSCNRYWFIFSPADPYKSWADITSSGEICRQFFWLFYGSVCVVRDQVGLQATFWPGIRWSACIFCACFPLILCVLCRSARAAICIWLLLFRALDAVQLNVQETICASRSIDCVHRPLGATCYFVFCLLFQNSLVRVFCFVFCKLILSKGITKIFNWNY